MNGRRFIVGALLVVLFISCGSSKQYDDVIPGIAAADVHMNFTNKGFELKTNYGSEQTEWTCKRDFGTHAVTITGYGHGSTNITSISGVVLNQSDQPVGTLARDVLGYLASIKYTNASEQDARAWVLANIDKTTETEFSGVKFSLNANAPMARILRISKK